MPIEYGEHTYGEIKIIGPKGVAKVGKYCSIAAGVRAIMCGHHPEWVTTYPFSDRHFNKIWPEAAGISGQPNYYDMLNIGSDVWIGESVLFVGGHLIGDGAVIGAGAVVTKDVAPYEMVGGNPARHIRFRFSEKQRLDLLAIRWWNWPEKKIRENIQLLCSNNIDGFINAHRGRK